MPLTISNSSSIFSMLTALNRLETERSDTMLRLTTGKRINKAADDPSGLVIANGLKSDLSALDAALQNNQRSQSVLNTADSTLQEVSKLVGEIESLAGKAQDPNATDSEKAAYQSTIDQNLNAVDRLINNAEFAGKKLFTGTSTIAAADSGNGNITDLTVHSMDPNATADKTMVVDATDLTAVTVDGKAATVEKLKKDDGTDSDFIRVHYTNGDYSLSFTMDSTTAAATDELTVTANGGLKFALGTDTQTRSALDLGAGVTTAELGSGVLNAAGDALAGALSSLRSGGANAITATGSRAAEIAKEASSQVAIANARVGSFNKYQIGSTINSLNAAKEGLVGNLNIIEDTDYAADSAKLERQNILLNASISMLGMASSMQANVLALLR